MVQRYRLNLRLNCVENHPTGNYVTHVDYAAVEADHAEALARLDDAELMLRAMAYRGVDQSPVWRLFPKVDGSWLLDRWPGGPTIPLASLTDLNDKARAAMLADVGGE